MRSPLFFFGILAATGFVGCVRLDATAEGYSCDASTDCGPELICRGRCVRCDINGIPTRRLRHEAGKDLVLNFSAENPAGRTPSLLMDAGVQTYRFDGGTFVFTPRGKWDFDQSGLHTFEVRATDDAGCNARETFEVEVFARPPTILINGLDGGWRFSVDAGSTIALALQTVHEEPPYYIIPEPDAGTLTNTGRTRTWTWDVPLDQHRRTYGMEAVVYVLRGHVSTRVTWEVVVR